MRYESTSTNISQLRTNRPMHKLVAALKSSFYKVLCSGGVHETKLARDIVFLQIKKLIALVAATIL